MRMHGSVTPKMILPILLVGAWATAISCICFHRDSEYSYIELKDSLSGVGGIRLTDNLPPGPISRCQQHPAHRSGFRGWFGFVVPQFYCV